MYTKNITEVKNIIKFFVLFLINEKRILLWVSENTIKNIIYCSKINNPSVLIEIRNAVNKDKINNNFNEILLLFLIF